MVVLYKSTNTMLGPSLLSIKTGWTTGVHAHKCVLYKYMISTNGGTLQMLNMHKCVLYKYTFSSSGGTLQMQTWSKPAIHQQCLDHRSECP